MGIENLNISYGLENVLKRAGISTVEDILALRLPEFQKIQGLGNIKLAELYGSLICLLKGDLTKEVIAYTKAVEEIENHKVENDYKYKLICAKAKKYDEIKSLTNKKLLED